MGCEELSALPSPTVPATPFKIDVIKAPSMAPPTESAPCYLLKLPNELLLWILGYAITKEQGERHPHIPVKSKYRRSRVDVEDDGLQQYGRHIRKELTRFLLCKSVAGIAKDAIRDSMRTGTLSVSIRQEKMVTRYTTLRLTGTLCPRLSYNLLTRLDLTINTGMLSISRTTANYHIRNACAGIIAFLRQYPKLKELAVSFGPDVSAEGRDLYRKALEDFASADEDEYAPVIALRFVADEISNSGGQV